MTSHLIYNYQVMSKSLDEALLADKEKMQQFEQVCLSTDWSCLLLYKLATSNTRNNFSVDDKTAIY